MEKWEDITEETLRNLSYDKNMVDSQIAELYGVTKGQVAYKRRKFGLTQRNKIADKMYMAFSQQNSDLFQQLNNQSKERLLKKENIDGLSKAITHYAFRNGPVEDMHGEGKLTQEDMKTLNKYMVNRLAGLFTEITEGNWLRIELLYNFYQMYGTDWDIAEPDLQEFDMALKDLFDNIKD